MNFLFLGRGEFRDHDLKRFGRDYLKKNEHKYLYLNINEVSIIEIIAKVDSKKFKKRLNIVLLNQYYNIRILIIIYMLKLKYKSKIIHNLSDPHIAYFINNYKKLQKYNKYLIIKKLYLRIFFLINIFFTKLIHIDYIITSGLKSNYIKNQFTRSKSVVEINTVHHDYEFYKLYNGKDDINIYKKSICYLDQVFPSFSKEEKFEEKIIHKLMFLSKTHKVFFCCHPSSKIINNKFFVELKKNSQIQIIYNDTLHYILKCEYVLTHHSASTNFAILNYKKILFLYSQEIKKFSTDYLIIEQFAKELNLPLTKIEDLNIISDFNINKNLYKNFINNYLYINKKNFPIWKFVTSKINL